MQFTCFFLNVTIVFVSPLKSCALFFYVRHPALLAYIEEYLRISKRNFSDTNVAEVSSLIIITINFDLKKL